MKSKTIFTTACILLATGVVLGAFAAHGLKDKVSPYHLDVFQKGVFYQIVHGLALLILAFNAEKLSDHGLKYAFLLMILGVIFFSGSLYVLGGLELQRGDSLLSFIGPITPIGGLCFIIGWVVLAFSYRNRDAD